MLEPRALIQVGISRLRLPIGAHKLLVVHDIAHALRSQDIGSLVADALLEWIAGLYLESEVAEALAAVVLARNAGSLQAHQLQAAIARPSVLSQAYIRQVFGIVLDVSASALPHSGPIPAFHRSTSFAEELREGSIVPGILWSQFRSLKAEHELDFLGQWAFEFQCLTEMYPASDGQLSYFLNNDHGQSSAQFVARRGHLARSAYLRTIAYAIDAWGMPMDAAWASARLASPFDPFYLRMPPGATPEWAVVTQIASSFDRSDVIKLLGKMDRALEEGERGQRVVQFSGPIQRGMRRAVDLDVYTVLCRDHNLDAERVLGEYQALLGATLAPRMNDGNISMHPASPEMIGEQYEKQLILALRPTFGGTLGYMHAELISRMPYVPANYSRESMLVARPRAGGADLELDGALVGQVGHWNVAWKPSHLQGLGPCCANSVTLARTAIQKLLNVSGFSLKRVWRAKILKRDSDFGSWTEEVISGVKDLDN
jgi:hypothetical protein